ncbi:MAG TPA: YIP1 family protein [Acidimicrobiia bacterium]
MKKIFGRAWRGALLKKRAFQEVYWDSDSTADGVIVVAAVQVVLLVASLVAATFGVRQAGLALATEWDQFLTALISAMIYGVAGWLILAGAAWLAATKIFKQNGTIQTMMAMHGLAYLPLLATLLPFTAADVLAIIWYLVVVVVATREAVETDTKTAALSVLVGYGVLAILASIFGGVFSAVPVL